MWEFTWRVSDCEELVGVTHRGDVNELVYEMVFLAVNANLLYFQSEFVSSLFLSINPLFNDIPIFVDLLNVPKFVLFELTYK